MKNNDFEALWEDVEQHAVSHDRFYQRIVYVDLLYRVYIGSIGIPAVRFLSLEIPERDAEQFDGFSVPLGFTLEIRKPVINHEGFVTCVLQASSSDQNDVFTIVAKDILDELTSEKKTNGYITVLKKRIEKWRHFFQNPTHKRLSDEAVIGLIGELSFVNDLFDSGIGCGIDMWNGPIKAAQDFQGKKTAIEVKTISANIMEYLHISSEEQLDTCYNDIMFLVAYRVERNDANGMKLPELITSVSSRLQEAQRTRFFAKLTCLGYSSEDNDYYAKGYTVKERQVYAVSEGFPCILPSKLPYGIRNVRYEVMLQCCTSFSSDFETIVRTIKENEYGQG